MRITFKYFIVYIVSIFFIISACEVSTKYFTNTFDDVYDYYIHTDTHNVQPTVSFFLNIDVIPTISTGIIPHLYYSFFSEAFRYNYRLQTKTKLFIKNSLLLI